MWLGLVLLCSLFCVHNVVAVERLPPRHVRVAMSSKFDSSPLLLEAGEFFADVSRAHFWSFMDHASQATIATEQDAFEFCGETASRMSLSHTRRSLEYSLAIHAYAPKIAMYSELLTDHLSVVSESAELASSCASLLLVLDERGHALACDPNESDVKRLLSEDSDRKEGVDSLDILEQDHVYDGGAQFPFAVLYSNPLHPSFSPVHTLLSDFALHARLKYVFRPKIPVEFRAVPLRLQGYGAELRIKSLEYKVMDDKSSSPSSSASSSSSSIDNLHLHPELEHLREYHVEADDLRQHQAEEDDDTPVFPFKRLGLQATQVVVDSSDPMAVLQDLSQNFPEYHLMLTRESVDEDLERAAAQVTSAVRGSNVLSVNGIPLRASSVDLFTLQKIIMQETALVDALLQAGLDASGVKKLLVLKLESGKREYSYRPEAAVDMRPLKSTPHAVTWFNDLAKDSIYADWPKNARVALQQPSWPGQLKMVGANIYETILVVDGSSCNGMRSLQQSLALLSKGLPSRLGVIFHTGVDGGDKDDEGAWPWSQWANKEAMKLAEAAVKDADVPLAQASSESEASPRTLARDVAWLFHSVVDEEGADKGVEFVQALASRCTPNKPLTSDFLAKALSEVSVADDLTAALSSGESLSQVVSSAAARAVEQAEVFLRRKGLSEVMEEHASSGVYLVTNGAISDVQPNSMRNSLVQAIMQQQYAWQEAISGGKLPKKTKLQKLVYEKDNVYPRHSKLVGDAQRTGDPHLVWYVDDVRVPFGQPVYLTPVHSTADAAHTTVWLAVDMSHVAGVELVLSTVEMLLSEEVSTEDMAMRVAWFNNPHSRDAKSDLVSRVIISIQQQQASMQQRLLAIRDVLVVVKSLPSASHDMLWSILQATLQEHQMNVEKDEFQRFQQQLAAEHMLAHDYLRLAPGSMGVAVNGKVVRLGDEGVVQADDLVSLVQQEWKSKARSVAQVVQQHGTADDTSALYLQACHGLGLRSLENVVQESLWDDEELEKDESMSRLVLRMGEEQDEVFIELRAVLDPLSPEAQRLVPMLRALHSAFGASVEVLLQPTVELRARSGPRDLPNDRFYRYVVQPKLVFNENGAVQHDEQALFIDLPHSQLLTLGVNDVPEAWLVRSSHAPLDLDNIMLNKHQPGVVSVEYTLSHLLLAGQCLEDGRKPAAGAQLILGTDAQPHQHDTIAMENLGYFQLQADPGVWNLRLAPGRASSVYHIDAASTQGKLSHRNQRNFRVAVQSFTAKPIFLKLARNEGMESATLDSTEPLPSPASGGGLWNSLFGAGDQQKADEERAVMLPNEDDTVHVFSVASGHLYERFLRIMMLSVVENSSSPVKFWFLEQFLSPEFKDFLPEFAEEFGFRVELVTYKWPQWLRRQTEKQREIWGFKILFLDVLFPLNIKRIVFVDADQVVRADMTELKDLDLDGKVYAYTPFCDSNPDTEGFRFWKQGYWKNHLRGKPYHISALYVVDLERFRRERAGDRLRIVYDQLSRDPNSLANLDQDLPNYAQSMVPMHSLPQEWLWCETWCSSESLATAKTIDLCNNPLTKEPKIHRAHRIISEWGVLDTKAENVARRLRGEEALSVPAASEYREYEKDEL